MLTLKACLSPGSSTENASFVETEGDFWTRLLNFLRLHWQLVGYLVIGIGGASLVPVLSELVTLKGIDGQFDCIVKEEKCTISNGTLLILLGYGIISGYSAVRLLRSIGSLLINSLSQNFLNQQQSLDAATTKIKELETKVETLQKVQGPHASFVPDRALAETSAPVVSNYFNDAQNGVDKKGYYSGVDLNGTQDLLGALGKLLTTTHRSKLHIAPQFTCIRWSIYHSSHNATLRQGLDLMNDKKLMILIPVNEQVSTQRKFAMLKPDMLRGYHRKSKGRVLRSDTIFQDGRQFVLDTPFVDETTMSNKLHVFRGELNDHLYIEVTVKD